MSCDSQNVPGPPCESLEIFCFPKYTICGTTIHKTQFFFHWIDFKYLYRITNLFSTDYHTYTLYESADILLQYISQTLNVTNIYYIDDRLLKSKKINGAYSRSPNTLFELYMTIMSSPSM
jgi:hypothetical protein